MIDLAKHPCFSSQGHAKYGRLHIPCAPKCNFNCAYCGRGLDAGEAQLPGRTMRIVKPEETKEYVSEKLALHPEIAVLGIAGPGEPLFNPETFRVLEILRREFPGYILCMGTNGYLLPENVLRLKKLGVETITVTLNSIRVETNQKLNSGMIGISGKGIEGACCGEMMVERQLQGIEMAASAGMLVKVNTVYVPGINDGEMAEIAQKAHELGAYIMNIMPLRPAGRLQHLNSPSPLDIHNAREQAERYLPQFRSCMQCRADACGVLSKGESADSGALGACYK